MIITCKACNTSFNLDDKMIKPTGSKVRCSVCADVFTAFPHQAPTPEPAADPVDTEPAPETKTTSESNLAAASAVASVGMDAMSGAEPADAQPAETDVLEEESADTGDEGSSDLDLGLEDESEEGVSDFEIEDAVSDVLNEDQTDGFTESESDVESSETIIASLDDDDFSLDLSPENTDGDGAATVIANIDDDLDFSLDELPDVDETIIVDLDKEDFDLDVPSETDGDSDGTATVIASLDDDTLDMDDLDFSLDLEPEIDVPSDGAVVSESIDSSLDDLSLDFDLETDSAAGEAEPEVDSDDAIDDDLELTLALDDMDTGEMEPDAEMPELEDDLDLSSLESLLMDDEDGEDDMVTMIVDDGEEPELALDMGDEADLDEGVGDGLPEETLEDLEFHLDAEGGDETADIDIADGDDHEIDLSEIEKMLEEPEIESSGLSDLPEQDLDLDIEASLETEKWMAESGDKDTLVKDEELDLSEFEQALEDVDVDLDESDEALEEQELALDLDDGEVLGTADETVAIDNELDFDLSDFEDDLPAGDDAYTTSREPADMELEFEVESGSQVEQTMEEEGLAETIAILEQKEDATEKAPSEPIAAAPPVRRPKPVKKGANKSLVFLLILLILGGGGYGTYYLLNQNGIDIPFLSDYLKPKVNDPGNLKLTTYDINSKFVDNTSAGKLFVVSGMVKNGYTENRGMITLLGKLFSTGKVPVNTVRVYCGNVMSDLELGNLEWDKIEGRLSNRLGDNQSNVKLEPGKSIPFMVVFSSLPDDLEEFTIEVTGSTTLK